MTDAAFIKDILKNPLNKTILERLAEIDLADAWLVSGAVFQTIWNIITGREPTFAIKDYDIFYFDSDASWEAEDAIIQQTAQHFGDLGARIEIRNQARVHLWYPEKFGMPYQPATKATDGIDCFLMHCAQVGILARNGGYDIYAPHGYADIENLIVRPNRTANFRADLYLEKAVRWKSLWPELTILPAETGE